MAIGMTYEQYWYGDPLMVRAFYKAEKLRQQRENQNAWMYGAYTARALDAIVGNMFRKTGDKPAEYPREPIPLTEKETEEQKKMRAEQEVIWAEAYMSNMVLMGKNWGKK